MAIKPQPFWYTSSNNRLEFDRLRFVEEFLTPLGFVASYKEKILFKKSEINNTIYSLSDSEELYGYVLGFLKNTSEDKFSNPDFFGVEVNSKRPFWKKRDVLNRWMVLGLDICLNIFKSMKVFKGFSTSLIFRDTNTECFLSFKNGIVRIDKNSSDLIPSTSIKGKYRFTTSLIENFHQESKFDSKINIGLNLDCEFSMYLKSITSIPKNGDNSELTQPKFGKEYLFYEPDYNALISGIGYLVHNKGLGGLSKMVLLQDRYMDGVNAKGGTGKSLVVSGLRKVVKVYEENAGHLDVRSQFKYQGLNYGDKVFFLDELHPSQGLKISQLFTDITSQIVVQKKFRGSFVLRGDDCPKLIGATNFLIFNPQSNSELRRLHICEIGNLGHFYPGEINLAWNSKKRLFDDWDKSDWNEFYNFIFYCVKFYLKNGLVENPKPNWKFGNLNSGLYQKYGTEPIEWVLNYLNKTRIKEKHYLDGLDPLARDLFLSFLKDMGDSKLFNETRFKKMVFEVCEIHGYTYNPLQIGRGNTPNARKKQRGGKHCIHITHPNDPI